MYIYVYFPRLMLYVDIHKNQRNIKHNLLLFGPTGMGGISKEETNQRSSCLDFIFIYVQFLCVSQSVLVYLFCDFPPLN